MERKTASVSFLFDRLSSHTQSDVKDAANWPNVRTNVSTHRPTDSTYLQPFKEVNPATFEGSSSDWLQLLDGSSNHEKAARKARYFRVREIREDDEPWRSCDSQLYELPRQKSTS